MLHAVNNVLVFTLAGFLGEGVATTEVPLHLGLLALSVSLLTMAAYVVVVARTRGRLKPEVSSAAQDLRTAAPPVPATAG